MKTLKESLLDDEDVLVKDDADVMINDWLDSHMSEDMVWYDLRNNPRFTKHLTRVKDGYSIDKNVILDIEMGDDTEIPKYINLYTNGKITIYSDASKLDIKSTRLCDEDLSIVGDSLNSISAALKGTMKHLYIRGTAIKTINMPGITCESLSISGCPNLDLNKCKLPKVTQSTRITREQLSNIVTKSGLNLYTIEME